MSEKKLFPSRTYHVYAPRDLTKRWFVYYYDQRGKRIRRAEGINKWKTARRRMKAAQELIQTIKAELLAKPIPSQTEKALRDFLEENKGKWSATTHEEYLGLNDAFCAFLNGREVNEGLVRKYMAQLRIRLAAATWNKHRYNIRRNLIGIGCPDWFDTLPPVKPNSTPARYFQDHQADRLGRLIRGTKPQLWLYVQFLFFTFIRPKELRGLRAGDILLDAEEIRVPASISKNKKTQFVAIPDRFLPHLEFIKEMAPGELIFKSKRGGHLHKGTMWRYHKQLLERLNFGKEYTLYSWKHTGAIALYRKGVSIKEIQLQMRHHSLDQTDQYLRQLGARDVVHLRKVFPAIIKEEQPIHKSEQAVS